MPPDTPFRPLDSEDAFHRAVAHSHEEPVVLYKHSATCSLSTWARREVLKLTETGDPPVYELVVQRAHSLSRRIAEAIGVHHASPQAIVLYRGAAVAALSHHRVDAGALRKAAAHPEAAG